LERRQVDRGCIATINDTSLKQYLVSHFCIIYINMLDLCRVLMSRSNVDRNIIYIHLCFVIISENSASL
jgi:hypothetical protein